MNKRKHCGNTPRTAADFELDSAAAGVLVHQSSQDAATRENGKKDRQCVKEDQEKAKSNDYLTEIDPRPFAEAVGRRLTSEAKSYIDEKLEEFVEIAEALDDPEIDELMAWFVDELAEDLPADQRRDAATYINMMRGRHRATAVGPMFPNKRSRDGR